MRITILTGNTRRRVSIPVMLAALVVLSSLTVTASAQTAQHSMTDNADQTKQLMDQIAELRAQVGKLQSAVQQTGSTKKPAARSGMKMGTSKSSGMGMMDDKGDMGMPSSGMSSSPGGMGMKDDVGEMANMSSGSKTMPSDIGMMEREMGMSSSGGQTGMPSTPAAAMGMCCMGEMGGMPAGANNGMRNTSPSGAMAGMSGPSSALPGQPGASHLYHIGSTGFFLNHPRHITLTPDEKLTLNRLKERAMLERAAEQRQIDQAEQELYMLTGADQPDQARIQAKVAEIEKLRAEQRMNFIRAVGEAGNVLTPEQRQALLGTMSANRK